MINSDPYIGAIVHYRDVTTGGRCFAAVITEVQGGGQVALRVFLPPVAFQPDPDSLNRAPHVYEDHPDGWHWRQECY